MILYHFLASCFRDSAHRCCSDPRDVVEIWTAALYHGSRRVINKECVRCVRQERKGPGRGACSAGPGASLLFSRISLVGGLRKHPGTNSVARLFKTRRHVRKFRFCLMCLTRWYILSVDFCETCPQTSGPPARPPRRPPPPLRSREPPRPWCAQTASMLGRGTLEIGQGRVLRRRLRACLSLSSSAFLPVCL